MTTDKRAVGCLVACVVLGAGTVLFTFGFLREYGTTSGSWKAGAMDGLTFGAVTLVLTAAFGVFAYILGRRSARMRMLAVAAIVLSVGGVLAAGAQAAVTKYDQQARLPDCVPDEAIGGPAESMLRAVQDAFSELEHPDRFSGGGSTGINGCTVFLLNVSRDEAAAHYRDELPTAGWDITRDDDAELEARKDGLVFVLGDDRQGSGMVAVAIRPAEPITLSDD